MIDDSVPRSATAPYAYLLTTMVLFGAAFASSKEVVGALPHDVAASLRFGGGALILLALLWRRRDGTSFAWADLVRAGAVGLVGVFAYNFVFFWALTRAAAIDGSVIVPVVTPVLTIVFLVGTGREPASAGRVIGLAVALAGAVVFFAGVRDGDGGPAGTRLAGDLLYVVAAGCWATYTVASKHVIGAIDPLRATTYATVVGALALTLVALPSMARTDWAAVPATTWVNVGFLAVGPTAVAYLSYFRGLRLVSAAIATLAMFTVPVFGATASVIFLGESFPPVQILGAAIMGCGALLAVTRGAPAVVTAKRGAPR